MTHEHLVAEASGPPSVLTDQLNNRIYERLADRAPLTEDPNTVFRTQELTASNGSEVRIWMRGPAASTAWDWRLRIMQRRFAVSSAGGANEVSTEWYESRYVDGMAHVYSGSSGEELADDTQLARLLHLIPPVKD